MRSDRQLVILLVKFNPLACFLCDLNGAFLVLNLTFAEDIDVVLLVLGTESYQLSLVKL